ncbi:hypothetical protein CDAR_593611 [Caerostris darwini]|uniref:Uncharacterized protein n=1 Tax=Caerostris darwini TaxID=1538125 RepID=A0AAV4S0D0_9ARAC|nr:hypothetical protein CDAR_593611 [Caerostris darwini]
MRMKDFYDVTKSSDTHFSAPGPKDSTPPLIKHQNCIDIPREAHTKISGRPPLKRSLFTTFPRIPIKFGKIPNSFLGPWPLSHPSKRYDANERFL